MFDNVEYSMLLGVRFVWNIYSRFGVVDVLVLVACLQHGGIGWGFVAGSYWLQAKDIVWRLW